MFVRLSKLVARQNRFYFRLGGHFNYCFLFAYLLFKVNNIIMDFSYTDLFGRYSMSKYDVRIYLQL